MESITELRNFHPKSIFLIEIRRKIQSETVNKIDSWLGLVAWHSARRVRLHNRRSRVRTPPGCKVFRSPIAVLLSKLNLHCHCANLRKINSENEKQKT
jgi:hypothetical protein